MGVKGALTYWKILLILRYDVNTVIQCNAHYIGIQYRAADATCDISHCDIGEGKSGEGKSGEGRGV